MASHLTLRTRQGTHDLLAVGVRFPASPCPLCSSPPEVFIEGKKRRLVVTCSAVDNQGTKGLRWQCDGAFDIAAW
jgi:hypothetical protein